MDITTSASSNAKLLLELFNAAQKNITSENIKAKVKEIYYNKNFSDEEKIRKIQAKIDAAGRKNFWVGATLGLGAGVAALLTAFFKEK